MPDYKEMYLTLFRATEQAINTLIAAQQSCEELYVNQPEPKLTILPGTHESGGLPENETVIPSHVEQGSK